MKYKTAKVVSHPRAGSHYLAKLLNENFFHKKDYLELYAGHSRAHEQHIKNKDTAVIYIFRNREDTMKSIFKLRDRFGLVCDDYETFKSTKLCDMNAPGIGCNSIYNNGKEEKLITKSDSYLGGHNMNIEEYLNEHIYYWINLSAPNYTMLPYEYLILDFEDSMHSLASFLGSDKTEFTNIYQQIGWYNSSEGQKIFS